MALTSMTEAFEAIEAEVVGLLDEVQSAVSDLREAVKEAEDLYEQKAREADTNPRKIVHLIGNMFFDNQSNCIQVRALCGYGNRDAASKDAQRYFVWPNNKVTEDKHIELCQQCRKEQTAA